MFAVMRETDFYNKPRFRENFWNDWRKLLGKNHVIQKLDDCDFTPIYDWHWEEKKVKFLHLITNSYCFRMMISV